MKGLLKIKKYSLLRRMLCYAWVFIYSGLLLFYMILTLPKHAAMNPYSGLKCYPGLPLVIIAVLCISFVLINHRYVAHVVDKTKILFAEILTVLFTVVYCVLFAIPCLYGWVYALFDCCQEGLFYVGGILFCIFALFCQIFG